MLPSPCARSLLVALLVPPLLAGCSVPPQAEHGGGQHPAPECEQAGPSQVETTSVTWTLTFDPNADGEALPSLRSRTASGLMPGLTVVPEAGDYLTARSHSLSFEPLRLQGSSPGDVAGFERWFAQVQAVGEVCAGQEPDVCARTWSTEDLTRSGTLVAQTSAGETIASWRLVNAWPVGLSSGGSEVGIISLTLSALVEAFSYGTESQKVAALFPSPATAVSPPTYPDVDTAESATAFRKALEAFRSRYDGPQTALERLNVLSAQNERAQSATGEHRFTEAESNFKLEIDGVVQAAFKEVSGLASEVEVIEFRNGDSPNTHYRPGRTKVARVTLKRGQSNGSTLLDWYGGVLRGDLSPRSARLLYEVPASGAAMPQPAWNFFEAWPSRWKAPDLNSHAESHAVEELEFAVERVEKA